MLLRLLLIVVATVAIVIATATPGNDTSPEQVDLTSLVTGAELVGDGDLAEAIVVTLLAAAPMRPHTSHERAHRSRPPSSPDASRLFRPPRVASS